MLLSEPESTSWDLRFRFFGVHVRVHPFFWLGTVILGFDWIHSRILPGNGVGDLALWVFCVFASILLHELGHVWMGSVFGSDGHIWLYGMGGLAVGSNDLSSRWKRILVSFAGPGIQILFWCALVGGMLLAGYRYDPHTPLGLLLEMLLLINLVWPIFNMLPVWPLDGGMITRELCTGVSSSRGLVVSLWISFVVSAALAINSLLAYMKKPTIPYIPAGGWYTMFLFGLLAVGSFQAIQHVKSRRQSYDDELPWER